MTALIALAGCGSGGGGGGGGGGTAPGSGNPPAVALMGTSFDATSGQIATGLTPPTTRTVRYSDGSEQVASYTTDTQRGVACVKVEEPDEPTIWLAKDTAGRVIVIREQTGDTVDEPARLEDTYYYPTRNPTVGTTWNQAGAEWEILSTNATAPRNGTPGCTLMRATFAGPVINYFWWSNANGDVEQATHQDLDPSAGFRYVVPPPVTLFGASFDPATSRQLFTELTLPSTQTIRYNPETPSGPVITETASYSADTQRGVACVKVEETNNSTRWYAKDTEGRVFIIRIQGTSGSVFEPTTMAQTYYFPTRNVSVGATWTANGQWEVISTTATAPRNGTTGCTLLRVSTSDGAESYYWWSNAKGEVERSSQQTVVTGAGFRYVANPAG